MDGRVTPSVVLSRLWQPLARFVVHGPVLSNWLDPQRDGKAQVHVVVGYSVSILVTSTLYHNHHRQHLQAPTPASDARRCFNGRRRHFTIASNLTLIVWTIHQIHCIHRRQHASTDDAGTSKHRPSSYNAYYHSWLTLNFTASDSSSDKVFLESVNSAIIDATGRQQISVINNSVQKHIFRNIQSKSFLEQFLVMSP